MAHYIVLPTCHIFFSYFELLDRSIGKWVGCSSSSLVQGASRRCPDRIMGAPAALSSVLRPSINQFFFHLYYFFQPFPIANAILRRFYSSHFLAKRHSLGVTCVFL